MEKICSKVVASFIAILNILILIGCGEHLAGDEDRKKVFHSYSSYQPILYNKGYGMGVWMMDETGSGKAELLNWGGNPSYSNDMSKIVFHAFSYNGIYVMELGSAPIQLTSTGFGGEWSPDGTQIAFTNATANPNYGSHRYIWLVNSDGSGSHQLSSIPGSFPSWSPDGSKIAFHGEVNNGIWLINPDGSGETQFDIGGGYPVWSPDGSKIAYIDLCDWYLWIMDSDGTNHFRISSEKSLGHAWSPDGTNLIYETMFNSTLRIVAIDGTNEHIIDSSGDAYNPYWGLTH